MKNIEIHSQGRVVYEVLRESYKVGMVEAALVEDLLVGAAMRIQQSGQEVDGFWCEWGGNHVIMSVGGRERKIQVHR